LFPFAGNNISPRLVEKKNSIQMILLKALLCHDHRTCNHHNAALQMIHHQLSFAMGVSEAPDPKDGKNAYI
jgi:hypothetical protein